jgi:hypothetical protein
MSEENAAPETDPGFRGDGYVEISVDEDGMTARAAFTPPAPGGNPITRGYVEHALKEQGIHHGIEWEATDEAIEACGEGAAHIHEVIVARGTSPVSHLPSHYVLHPSFAAIRNTAEIAATDPVAALHAGHGLPVAFSGQVVALLESERPGELGTNVYGEQVPFEDEQPASITAGKNTRTEGDRIVAAKSGLLEITDGVVSVARDLTLSCDIDNSTGNISFPGNLTLSGTVHDRFRLWVGGDLETKEVLDASEVFCRGKLTAPGGIIGKGTALVRSRGKVRAKFVESCTVESKSAVYVENFCYHARVLALDRLATGGHGKIVGGEVRTAHGVVADEIGNKAGLETRIVVGMDFIVERKLEQTKRQIEKLQRAIAKLDGRLASTDSSRLHNRRLRLAEKLNEYQVILSNLVGKLDRNERAQVVARSAVHTGTVVEICRAVTVVEDELGPSVFRLDPASGRIRVSPPEGGDEVEID